MLTGFALLGLVLAAVGLYGVISHLVAQRTGEFGIKLALGALPRDLLAEVLLRGVRLSAIGLAIGFVGAWGLGRFLASFMPRLAAPDPMAIAGVAGVLFAVTLVACWFPARRATKVDPLTALRAE
jgi:putative ABC transport system permease protein